MGGLCAPGARASAKSEGTGIHSSGTVTGRLAHAHYSQPSAAEHSSTRINSGHDWYGGGLPLRTRPASSLAQHELPPGALQPLSAPPPPPPPSVAAPRPSSAP